MIHHGWVSRVRVDDSPYHCPRSGCGKRLMLEVGPDDEGINRMWHCCWSCDYEELDRMWWPPRVRTRPGRPSRAVQQLKEMRLR